VLVISGFVLRMPNLALKKSILECVQILVQFKGSRKLSVMTLSSESSHIQDASLMLKKPFIKDLLATFLILEKNV